MLPSYHHSTPQPKWIIPESKTSGFQERGEFFEDTESPNREQENPFDINVAGRIINGLYSKHLRICDFHLPFLLVSLGFMQVGLMV